MKPLSAIRGSVPQMLEALEQIVNEESPSDDLVAARRCADAIGGVGEKILGLQPERIEVEGRLHLRWTFGQPQLLLIGHFDTVWPAGTTSRWPFEIDGNKASGPGVFDMKAGIVQGLYAVAALDDPAGVVFLLTSDEETGSKTSRKLIEETARRCRSAFVLEPSVNGALKTARKGVSGYTIEITGKAAHAGLEPEKGSNALVELAHQILQLEEIAGRSSGTTIVPTVSSSPTAKNTVPAFASVWIDVRVATLEEQKRVDREIRALKPVIAGTSIEIKDGPERPPLPETSSRELFAVAQRVADRLELGPLSAAEVGGGSDGNLTAAAGTPTLDGLGAVGDGAHAEGEHILISTMPERAALVAGLIEEVRSPS